MCLLQKFDQKSNVVIFFISKIFKKCLDSGYVFLWSVDFFFTNDEHSSTTPLWKMQSI